PEESQVHDLFRGKSIVVTGTLERFSRSQIEELIRLKGGRPTGSVSKTTSLVVVGADPGSKAAKARELGVRTMAEDEFVELVAQLGADKPPERSA
ncbi:MAG: hypothetical protein HY815_27910, partial [Candidatus Riflebacteria bacterium]|nr:hypothetical protein [Candidatus Riflebacteria bacterium]